MADSEGPAMVDALVKGGKVTTQSETGSTDLGRRDRIQLSTSGFGPCSYLNQKLKGIDLS